MDLGRTLAGRYQIVAPIGQGGMGMVWRAHDTDLDRSVAIKELRLPGDLREEERRVVYARMEREARAAARLKHPGIVTVHDRIVADDGRPWIVMELIQGGSLADLIEEKGRLPCSRVVDIGTQMLEALAVAHGQGIVHRDIKPANVLLEGDRVVLTDFGIAALDGDVTLTSSGAILGTPAFMSPEQVRGLAATPESDLWSLGATLYAAAEGKSPFNGPSHGSVFVAIATEEPALPEHAGPLTETLNALLSKDPGDRPGVAELRDRFAVISRGAESRTYVDAPDVTMADRPGQAPPHGQEAVPHALGAAPQGPQLIPPGAPPAYQGRWQPPPAHGAGGAGPPPAMKRPSTRLWSGRDGLLFGGLGAVIVVILIFVIVVFAVSKPDSNPGRTNTSTNTAPASPTPASAGREYREPTTTFKGSQDKVAFSPDGKTLATVGIAGTPATNDKTVRLWEVATGRKITTLSGHTDRVKSLVFSPDGKTLATGGFDTTVRLWSVASHRAIAVERIKGPKRPKGSDFPTGLVFSMEFSPDGKTLAVNSNYNRAYLLDVKAKRITKTVKGFEGEHTAVAVTFKPDGTGLAARHDDKIIRVSDLASGDAVATLKGQKDWMDTLRFSPDHKTVAVGARADNAVRIWDLQSAKVTVTLNPEGPGAGAVVDAYTNVEAFSPDGKILAVSGESHPGNQGVIRLWDATSGKLTGTVFRPRGGAIDSLSDGSFGGVAFSMDGKSIAVAGDGGEDKTSWLWKLG